MKKENISFLLMIYGFLFACFMVLPAFLNGYLWEPVSFGDGFDLFTPFVIIPVVYILFKKLNVKEEGFDRPHKTIDKTKNFLLLSGIIFFIDGHGIHFSANSIARYLFHWEETEVYRAAYVYDEIIGHFFWDLGVFVISLAMIAGAISKEEKPAQGNKNIYALIGAPFYGFTFAVNGIEGQTVIFTFPAALLGAVLSFYLLFRKKELRSKNSVYLFFAVGYTISLILFLVWWIWQKGFPQFSELGWI